MTDYSKNIALASGRLDEDRAYWQSCLPQGISFAGFPPSMVRGKPNRERIEAALPADLAERILAASRGSEEGAFILLSFGLAWLLGKYNGTRDVLLAAPVLGRQRHLDRPLLNTVVPLFVHIDPEQTFREGLAGWKRTVAEAMRHQNFPLFALAELVDLPLDGQGRPVVRTLVQLDGLHDAGVVAELDPDLRTVFCLDDGSATCGLDFDGSLYTQDYVQGIGRHLITFLSEVLRQPDLPLKGIEVLSRDERRRLLEELGNTRGATQTVRKTTFPELFTDQVHQVPDRPAVVFRDQVLTYRDLAQRSYQLAHRLLEEGLQSEDIVGILLPPSAEMIVGVVAVLEAGGVYLPLDIGAPAARINHMLDDSGARVLLAGDDLPAKVRFSGSVIDPSDPDLASRSLSRPTVESSCRDAAYVIYTSGTTDRPKGVVVDHGALAHLCSWYTSQFGVSRDDRCAKYCNFTFDVSSMDIHAHLGAGATLHVLDDSVRLDLDALRRYLVDHEITITFLPTPVYESLDALEEGSLRLLLTGGDKLRRFVPGPYEVHNLYGPTEATVVTTGCVVSRQSDNIPIGRPIDHARVYVVDPNTLRLQPAGVAGEICIGGPGLARGYLNSPELTARAFVEDPYSSGERLYRTGDLGRWSPDGTLQFIGRSDSQVKIQGVRIETAEVETCLLELTGIRQAFVAPVAESEGKTALAAYLVGNDDRPNHAELRGRLQETLPDVMIPRYLVYLDELPLSRNGKIDLSRLPDPRQVAEPVTPPAGKTEVALVEILAEVLKISADRISIGKSFFELGGNSLAAMTLVSRVQQRFDIRLPLHLLFGESTIGTLAETIGEATHDKQVQLIDHAPIQDHYLLSPGQRRLFVLQQLDGSTAYNIPLVLRIHGQIDLERVEETFRRLIQRHEILRTSFAMADGRPFQRVESEVEFEIEVCDTNEGRLDETIREMIRPFDLQRAPLLRCLLIRAGSGAQELLQVLLIDMHHIISDAASLRIIAREFLALYAGRQLDEPRLQYRDYAVWQVSEDRRKELEAQRQYWLSHLSEGIWRLDLPTDLSRPPVWSSEGRLCAFPIDEALVARLKTMARQNDLTLFMVLLGALAVVLARLSGQDELVIGTPVEGRRHPDLEPLVGMLVNTLPLKITVRHHVPIRSFLDQVRRRTLDALEHQDYPLDDLVDDLNLPRDPSRNPIFDVVLAMQPVEVPETLDEGVRVSSYPFDTRTSKFDLTLNALEVDDDLSLSFEYATSVLSESTVETLARSLTCVLEQMSLGIDTDLCDIELTSHQERSRLLCGLQRSSDTTSPEDKTLVDLFEDQAARTPQSTAVVFENSTLSYGQLRDQARLLASRLTDSGVRSQDVVGLFIEPSMDTVISILGVLEAGAAYLPISVEYPTERVRFMVDDSRAQALVTNVALPETLVDSLRVPVVHMSDALRGEGSSSRNKPEPSDLAYVLYTSGSTGTPKAVMVEHRNVVRLFAKDPSLFDFGPADVWTLYHSYCFDFSVWEIFGALLSGGEVVVVPSPTRLHMAAFFDLLQAHKVTVLSQTPSVFYRLIQEALQRPADLSLRMVIFGGEALKPARLETWHDRFPGVRLVNMYGITETTVHVTAKDIGREEIASGSRSVGCPIPATTVYVMDRQMKLLPTGALGELCVGGEGVSRGYLNRPDLTRERFVQSPYTEERLYRSGDLGRINDQGEIEHWGRIDQQVQLHGFRIEPGEIEAALQAIEGVTDAVVLEHQDTSENRYLAAYLVVAEGVSPTVLRHSLLQQLPVYMVPSRYFAVDAIPITPSGKVDRGSLDSGGRPLGAKGRQAAPTGDLEEDVLSVWRDVLENPDVGVDDNFFDVGGNSLRLMEVHSVLAARHEIQPVDLFVHTTARKLATFLAHRAEPEQLVVDMSGPDLSITEGSRSSDDVAVVGLGLRIGRCRTAAQLWDLLVEGTDLVGPLPRRRQRDIESAATFLGIDPAQLEFKELGYLDEIDTFDPGFFRLSPQEAAFMDPSQRLFLQVAWQALEDAGHAGPSIRGSDTGVFVGYSPGRLRYEDMVTRLAPAAGTGALVGNLPAMLAARISYLLDLRGPAMCVDTACSSSLVALHLAVGSIRRGECGAALAAGVKIELLPLRSGLLSEIESSDGRTKSFDDDSDGTGGGEGIIALLLKPLQRAESDGDHIYALIKGSAINQDGRSIGITAPNARAQTDVIVKAWKDAGIDPETISYIEAHGTGTRLGDPVELRGLTQAFGRFTDRRQFCAIGSVKANLGHLDTASGAASIVKCIMALENRKLPPLPHFQTPNREIPFETSPVYVQDRQGDWEGNGAGPLRCGVSSFGLSGTNCHVVLEERPAPERTGAPEDGVAGLLVLSARSAATLDELVTSYLPRLKDPSLRMGDLCFTAACGRPHHNHRVAVIGNTTQELRRALSGLGNGADKSSLTGVFRIVPASKELLDPGELTQQHKDDLDQEVEREMQQHRAEPDPERLRAIAELYVRGADPDWRTLFSDQGCRRVPLPTYPLERHRCWVEPEGLPAQHIVGRRHPGDRSTLPDVLLDRLALSSMGLDIYSVDLDLEQHWLLREHRVGGRYVLVGTAYLDLLANLAARYFTRSAAQIEDLVLLAPLELFEDRTVEVQVVVQHEPDVLRARVVSQPETQWVLHAEARVRPLTAQAPRQPLTELKALCPDPFEPVSEDLLQSNQSLVQVSDRWKALRSVHTGPGRALARLELDGRFGDEPEDFAMYPPLVDAALSFPMGVQDHPYLPVVFPKVWVYGKASSSFYSFLEQKGDPTGDTLRYDARLVTDDGEVFAQLEDITFRRVDTDLSPLLFFRRTWVQQEPPALRPEVSGRKVLVIGDGRGLADELIRSLRERGDTVVEAGPGEAFASLLEQTGPVQLVVHLASVGPEPDLPPLDLLRHNKQRGILGAFELVRALVRTMTSPVDLVFVSEHAALLSGDTEAPRPENAALFGFAKVIPQEYSDIRCRCIDLDSTTSAEALFQEICVDTPLCSIALRGDRRFAEQLGQIDLQSLPKSGITIQAGHCYLITGGLGGIGLSIARHLCGQAPVRLVLLQRSDLPDRDLWDEALARPEQDKVHSRIIAIREMEAAGSEVAVLSADVADPGSLSKAVEEIHTRYGRICGIVHSAGLPGDGFIVNKQAEQVEQVLAPKMEGTLLLDEVTRDDEPDFFVLCSAMTAVSGAPGQSDYTAANAYLDAFALRRRRAGLHTLSINWPAWTETGMAVEQGADPSGVFFGIGTKEALAAFDMVLARDIESVCLGRPNLDMLSFLQARGSLPMVLSPRLRRQVEARGVTGSGSRPGGQRGRSGSRDQPVALKGRPDGAYGETETSIARIWADVLGFAEIDIHSTIYDLGGDSINAVNIINRINEDLSLQESIGSIFSKQTVYEYARYLDEKHDKDRSTPKDGYLAIPRVEQRPHYPLSSAQRRLYILHRLERSSTGYNLPEILVLEGALNEDRLESAFLTILDRHESLRTSFHLIDGVPRQQVHDEVDFHLVRREVDEADVDSHIDSFVRPFDLARAPLLRVELLRLTPDRALLLFDVHHIVADALSIEILLAELLAAYEVLPLPPVGLRYRDFAVWQEELLGSEAAWASEQYWVEQFENDIPVLSLPLDFPRPETQSYKGDVVTASVPAQLTRDLALVAADHRTTLYSLVLSAFFVVLHKYSGQDDIVVGSLALGRSRREVERLVGMFVNLLPIRSSPSPDKRFIDLSTEVQELTLRALDHQDFPFDELVERLDVPRDLSRSPLTDVGFSFMSFGRSGGPQGPQGLNEGARLGSVRVSPWEGKRRYAAKADITLFCTERNDLTLVFEYCSDLFTQATIQRLADHLVRALKEVVRSPSIRIGDLDLISEEEKERLVVSLNDTARDHPRDKTLVHLMDEQVKRTPDQAAIVCGDQTMTYQDLASWSAGLAAMIRAEVPGERPIVGMLIERRVEMVASMVAVLRSGGAYLPLDPRHPKERLAFMLADSGAQLLLTTRETSSEPVPFGGRVVVVDDSPLPWDGLDPLANETRPDDLAYLIYTSGTTGVPKGVEVEHGNLLNFVLGMRERIGFSGQDAMLALTTVSFDIFVLESLVPLCIGMKVVLMNDREAADPGLLQTALSVHGVDTIQVTPSRLTMVLDIDPSLSCLKDVSKLLVGGERFPDALLQRVNEVYQGRIYNLYGPTETTVWSTAKDLTGAVDVNIGTPIANTQVYILDEAAQLMPIGVPGELCIGGDGVARGYHGSPPGTEGRFLPDPFRPGNRLYRTGDMARWLESGELQVFGRRDSQVKVRGFRVELVEIEATVLEHPQVKACVVVDRQDPRGDTTLVAYLVTDEALDPAEVRRLVEVRLPDYMVPAFFMQIDAIPMTTRGKVDRKRLPAPSRKSLGAQARFVAPRDPLEQAIAQVWKEVLGLDQIGVHDGFFDLGGNSLKIVQASAELSGVLGREVDPLTLFTHPTVAALAEHQQSVARPKASPSDAERSPTPDDDELKAKKIDRGRSRLREQRKRRGRQ